MCIRVHPLSRQRRQAALIYGGTVQVDGFDVYYQSSGNPEVHNQTVVLVHGASVNSHLWRRQLPYLSRRCHSIAVDLPGHGRSDGLGTDVAGYSTFLLHFLTALALVRPIVLVGHGMGGLVALRFALDRPERVAGLVLTAVGSSASVPAELLAASERDDPICARLPALMPASAIPNDEVVHWKNARPEVRHADLLACHSCDLAGELGDLVAPALILVGACDVPPVREAAESLQAGVPGARLVEIEGAGHYPMSQHPGPFNAALWGFIRRL